MHAPQCPGSAVTERSHFLGLPKSQLCKQNQCLAKDAQVGLEQVCKAKSQPDLPKPTPEFPANEVIDLPALGVPPGAGDSADSVSQGAGSASGGGFEDEGGHSR